MSLYSGMPSASESTGSLKKDSAISCCITFLSTWSKGLQLSYQGVFDCSRRYPLMNASTYILCAKILS